MDDAVTFEDQQDEGQSPLDRLRDRVGRVSNLSQHEADQLLARLRAQAAARRPRPPLSH